MLLSSCFYDKRSKLWIGGNKVLILVVLLAAQLQMIAGFSSEPKKILSGGHLPSPGGSTSIPTLVDERPGNRRESIQMTSETEMEATDGTATANEQNRFKISLLLQTLLRGLVNAFWKGITIPFPSLRKSIERAQAASEKPVGLTLPECLLFLTGYFGTGVAAYSFIFEKWSIIDSLYFSCVCFSTVGYGDLCPVTGGGRAFTCLFGLAGIAFLGTTIATIGQTFVDAEIDAVNKAKSAAQQKIMSFFDSMPSLIKSQQPTRAQQGSDQHTSAVGGEDSLTKSSKIRRNVLGILRIVGPSLSIIALGGIMMKSLNTGWSWSDAFYYSVITASTIGLGDFAPQTPSARIFAVLFIPISVAAAGDFLSSIATYLMKRRQQDVYRQQLRKNLSTDYLAKLDEDKDGKVSQEEYVNFMLLEMGLASQEEFDELHRQFARLDVDGSGFLDSDDLLMMKQLRERAMKSETEQ